MRRPGRLPLLALAAILLSSAALWALALWPVAGASPEWLARARIACFRMYDDGLPDLGGWLTLIGEPVGMLALLFLVWGRQVSDGLRSLTRSVGGRLILASTILVLIVGLGAVVVRIRGVPEPANLLALQADPTTLPRLDQPAPPLRLTDQHGAYFDLEQLKGRPVLVTFGFAHCETVCPLLVNDALIVQHAMREAHAPAVVVVTLDPWRDTPARLPTIAREWGLGEDAYVLSGSIETVGAVLDAWEVTRWRDERNGDIAHSALTYLVDRSGRIAFAAPGGVELFKALLERI